MPVKAIYPRLAYDDEVVAAAWLVGAFGFTERDRKVNPDGSALIWLERDGNLVMVSRSGYGVMSPRELGGVSQKINVYLEGVDRHCERATAAGATIVRELDDMPVGRPAVRGPRLRRPLVALR